MPEPIPAVLESRVLPKPWGGRALLDALGLQRADGQPIGEVWEAFDRPDGASALRGGGGRTLRDLMREDPDALLGRGVRPAAGGLFPLLVKRIDANERLSVQVHPGAEQAREHGDGPKNEAWIVLEAREDARIVCGFKEGVTRVQVEAAFDSPALEPLLDSFRPVPWDVFRIDAGVVHSIGPGVVVYEVQQNSDLTFRIYDWGRGRELHLDAARRAMRVGGASDAIVVPEPIDGGSWWLIRTPDFSVRRLRCDGPSTLGTEGSFKLGTVLSGAAALGWRSGGQHPPLALRTGDTFLVPACVGSVFLSPIGSFEMLWTAPGVRS
ncbi:MAG: class I mannose-6-phosphate isomerase [Planctomycetes bacterium]|nr:class I mannose-6-phosphate isomerase [Planctomycetota bacterium]